MKKLLLSFLWLSFLCVLSVDASHFMGIDMTYECIGPCTYRIYHKTYYDCTGSATTPIGGTPSDPGASFDIQGNGVGCSAPTAIGNWQFVSYNEVTPICPGFATGCTDPNATINGVLEAIFYRDYNFCNTNCTQYTLTWGSCCRNYAITSGAGGDGIYSGVTQIDLGFSPCNSSPQFLNPPVPYICAGQAFTFNQGAFDIDGDSLSYSLGPCFDDPGIQVTYTGAQGYSPTQPMGSSWNVQVNSQTGDLTMTPNPGGNIVTAVLCLYVTEWRNGIQIGQVMRDIQITVIPCTFTVPQSPGVQNLTGGVLTAPNTIQGCVGTEICFNIPSINNDPSILYTMSWNDGITGGAFTDAFNPAIQDTLVGVAPIANFCWLPPSPGIYSFLVTIIDDNCPLPGSNQFTVLIDIPSGIPNPGVNAVPTIAGCNEYTFEATTSSASSFTYQWSGNGNLNSNPSNTDSIFTHIYPSPGTYGFSLLIEDSLGCKATIADSVEVGGATAEAGPNLSTCSNYQYTLGESSRPGYSYTWTPATGLNSSGASAPVFSFNNPGPAVDTFDFEVEAFDGVCTAVDYARVVVFPAPDITIAPQNPSICNGDSITLTAAGGTGYSWSTGDTTPTIRVAPNSTQTYSVISYENGCASVPAYTTVTVNEGPSGDVIGDFEVCPADDAQLTATGASTFEWSTGVNAPSITIANILQDTIVYFRPLSNGCYGDTIFAQVQVSDKPVADFISSTACDGTPTAFTNQSTIGSGAVQEWDWDFGDGGLSEGANPNHVYPAFGNYTTTLTITSDRGCKDTISYPVDVTPIPEPNFSFTNICAGTPMDFADQSSIAGTGSIIDYEWDFDDGNGSTDIDPSHTFGTHGYYNVELSLTSDNNCEASYSQTVFVYANPIADFETNNICEDKSLNFRNLSSVPGQFDFIEVVDWDFGDPVSGAANASSDVSPAHTFANPNTYTVEMIVTTQNNCADTTSQTITVYEEPVVDFGHYDNCEHQATKFIDLTQTPSTTQVVDWTWDFGNGTVKTGESPFNRYEDSGYGTYQVKLITVTGEGCIDSITKDVVINPRPKPYIWASTECLGTPTVFIEESQIASGSIISWDWNFGDGTTSNIPDPSHTFATPGFHSVYMTTTSDSGCVKTTARDVYVNPGPPDPAILDDTVCINGTGHLIANVPSDSIGLRWYYEESSTEHFHEGLTYVTPRQHTSLTYYVEPYTIQNNCIDGRYPVTSHFFDPEAVEILASNEVVELPLALVEFSTATPAVIADWKWEFGDGGIATEEEPAYQFQYPGIYEVKVQVQSEQGCLADATKLIEVKKVVGVHVPSAFSPNGDGINDNFKVGHYGIVDFKLKIFNRWGDLLYETDNADFEWNGIPMDKSKPITEGTYVYVLEALDYDGKEIKQSGTIIRIQ